MGESPSKYTLARWISLALKKALSTQNIKSGFHGIGIWPLNAEAVNTQCRLSEAYRPREEQTTSAGDPLTTNPTTADVQAADLPTTTPRNVDMDEEEGGGVVPAAEELVVDLDEAVDPSVEHFYVAPNPSEQQEEPAVEGVNPNGESMQSVTRFLSLPTLAPRVSNMTRS